MNEFMINTKRMTVGYHGIPVIKDIELLLRRGEILTLIGPNGAGKSTLLKSIAKQLRLIEGTVYLSGKDMRDISAKEIASELAIVMTERVNPELMTCEDVVAMGRYPYTGNMGLLTENDRFKIRSAMEMADVMEIADCEFVHVSDGQRQRVMLARAICQEPEIMILDEPTSFLDIKYKLELLSILKRLAHEKGVAIIMSLHEIDLAQKISDRIACIHDHRVERCGEPEDIFSSDYIERLYDVTDGSYNVSAGGPELAPVLGTPRVFVIGGAGTGIPVYRRLQRMGIPFAAGVIHRNDADYPLAKILAADLIDEREYEPISDSSFHKAVRYIDSCESVIASISAFGMMNEGNLRLKEYARQHNKLQTIEELAALRYENT